MTERKIEGMNKRKKKATWKESDVVGMDVRKRYGRNER